MTTQDSWILMPFIDCPAMTQQAVLDCLNQTAGFPRVLLIDQGSGQAASDEMRAWVETMTRGQEQKPKVLLWTFNPPLPSLSAVWNRALDFVWELGGTEALVVNNDVRLAPCTLASLLTVLRSTDALFASAVGVTEDQYNPEDLAAGTVWDDNRGDPDFSCFLLSRQGHEKYRFDESFRPAYCEDLDTHRRYMLGGDGHRIFSVNLPYLHYASRTLNDAEPATVERIRKQLGQSRAYYERKWGGPCNHETFYSPFNAVQLPEAGAWYGEGWPFRPTTPEMQEWWRHFAPVETPEPEEEEEFD